MGKRNSFPSLKLNTIKYDENRNSATGNLMPIKKITTYCRG
jgi:hypothetical protein